ncbi:MAG: hypothetical protein ACFE0Q_08385 [Anaerolineae bacterium]
MHNGSITDSITLHDTQAQRIIIATIALLKAYQSARQSGSDLLQ